MQNELTKLQVLWRNGQKFIEVVDSEYKFYLRVGIYKYNTLYVKR